MDYTFLNNPYVGKKAVQILQANLNRYIGRGKMFASNAVAETASGLPASTIHRARNAEVELGIGKLSMLARAIGVEPWELLHPDLDPVKRPRIQADAPKPPASSWTPPSAKPESSWPLPGVSPEDFKLVPVEERKEVIELIKLKVKRHAAIKSAKNKAA